MTSFRSRHVITAALAAVLFIACASTPRDQARHQRIGERCWVDVRFLASDALEGRRAGSPGHRRAAEHVAAEFRKAGLQPGGDGGAGDAAYLQTVKLEVRKIREQNSSLALVLNGEKRPLTLGDDAGFMLRGGFASEIDAPLVFAGHGLRLPEYGIDDLAGLDLNGKVVVAFNSAPTSVPGAVGAHNGSAAERWKIYGAAGAVGMILIPNPFTTDLPWARSIQSRLEPYMVLQGVDDQYVGQKLWAVYNPERLEKLLEGTTHRAEEILALLKDGKSMPHFDLAARVSAVMDVELGAVESENVVGILPGSDPALRDEYVVLSGHLDHLGVRESEGDGIFNGAVDNAAGIAVLLQVARDLGARKAPRRSVVFAAVTAEEMGLLGSRAYVASAQAAGRKIVANLNSDMFMPLYPLTHLIVFGLEESELGEDARGVAEKRGVVVQTDPQPQRNRFIRSDQYSFIRAGVPALATKIGVVPGSPEAEIERKWQAERYHAVSDDLDQPVDIASIGAYQELIRDLAVRVANRDTAPKWYPTSPFGK